MYPIDLPVRLILLPGLGANHQLFEPQKRVFRDALETPDFIEPASPNESIHSYAQRWAPLLKNPPGDERPLIVGGVSLGGMVAMEMAKAVGASAVVLISSARRDQDVPTRARLAELLGRSVPATAAPKMLSVMMLPFAVFNELDDDQFVLLKHMAADADPKVLKWGSGAISDWEFDGKASVPVHQVHGSKDWVFPPSGDADIEIKDGGHLINLTHDQTVNEFIAEVAEKVSGVQATPAF